MFKFILMLLSAFFSACAPANINTPPPIMQSELEWEKTVDFAKDPFKYIPSFYYYQEKDKNQDCTKIVTRYIKSFVDSYDELYNYQQAYKDVSPVLLKYENQLSSFTQGINSEYHMVTGLSLNDKYDNNTNRLYALKDKSQIYMIDYINRKMKTYTDVQTYFGAPPRVSNVLVKDAGYQHFKLYYKPTEWYLPMQPESYLNLLKMYKKQDACVVYTFKLSEAKEEGDHTIVAYADITSASLYLPPNFKKNGDIFTFRKSANPDFIFLKEKD